MGKTAEISILSFLLTIVTACEVGDICESLGRPGVVKIDKKCPYFASLTGPEMVRHGHCGFFDPFGTSLVCCPTRNQVESRFPQPKTVEEMCRSFQEKTHSASARPRIIGGVRAQVGEFPHFAALGYRDFLGDALSFDCAGALVSERFVLSAAHCCKIGRRPAVVRLGKTSLDPENSEDRAMAADYEVDRVILHHLYRSSQKYHDIAMIELKDLVMFSRLIWPACIEPEFNYSKTKNLIIAGFGRTDPKNYIKTSDWLMKAEVAEVPFPQCFEIYKEAYGETTVKGLRRGLTTEMICARNSTQHADTCQGDSGSALQMKIGSVYYVVGITSFGISCNSSLPSFYTRVSKYKSWIEGIW